MTPLRPPMRRRARGLAALVAAGAAMGALGGQAVASETLVEIKPPEPKKLQVKKSAHTFYAAYWKWDIEKTPSTRVGYNHENYHVRVGYKVTATPKVAKTGSHKVYGKIYMHNPSRRAIGILGVYDALHGEDGAKCRIGRLHGPGDNGNAAQEDNGILGVIPPKTGAYVEYRCYWDGEPTSRTGKNKAVVKWVYGPPLNGDVPLAAADEELMRRPKETHAYAPYDFSKGEVENRGYTYANVYDKMGKERPELIGEQISALDGVWMHSYYKYLRAPRKVNECIRVKNRAILIGKKAEAEQNAVQVEEAWGKVHADAYVKICTKEKKPSSEDPRPPDVVVSPGSSEDPPTEDPKPEKPADVKPSDFDPKDPPSSEDPKPNGKGKLHVKKRANKKRAYIGSEVVWTIRVKNKGDKALRNVHLKDVLPKYFRVKKERTRKVMNRKRGYSLKGRRVNVRIGIIRPGQTRTIRIATKVVGRPHLNKKTRVEASKKRAKARRVYIQRMRRGIACNVVMVRAKRTRDRDVACIRVIKPRNGPDNDRPEVREKEQANGEV